MFHPLSLLSELREPGSREPTHSSASASPVGTTAPHRSFPQQTLNPLLPLRRLVRGRTASLPRSSEMPLPLHRALSAAVSSARLRRGLSTAAASRPSWAMIYHTMLVNSTGPRASLLHAEPPLASHLLVPTHVVDPRPPRPDHDSDVSGLLGVARASSGDGFLLLDFWDGTARARQSTGIDMNPGITRVICNPLSGELFRLPGTDGTNDTVSCQSLGLHTRSEHPHGPPDRYAVADLVEDHDGEEQSFVMRRFLSQTGEWEKLVGLPSPLPLARRMVIDHAVLDFAGRLRWVDVSWGAVSADPLSDRPELHFVELPSGRMTKPVRPC